MSITVCCSGPVHLVWCIKGSTLGCTCAGKDHTSQKEIKIHMKEKGLQGAEAIMSCLARVAHILIRYMHSSFYLLVCFCSLSQKNYMVLHSHSLECSRGAEWHSKR